MDERRWNKRNEESRKEKIKINKYTEEKIDVISSSISEAYNTLTVFPDEEYSRFP